MRVLQHKRIELPIPDCPQQTLVIDSEFDSGNIGTAAWSDDNIPGSPRKVMVFNTACSVPTARCKHFREVSPSLELVSL